MYLSSCNSKSKWSKLYNNYNTKPDTTIQKYYEYKINVLKKINTEENHIEWFLIKPIIKCKYI